MPDVAMLNSQCLRASAEANGYSYPWSHSSFWIRQGNGRQSSARNARLELWCSRRYNRSTRKRVQSSARVLTTAFCASVPASTELSGAGAKPAARRPSGHEPVRTTEPSGAPATTRIPQTHLHIAQSAHLTLPGQSTAPQTRRGQPLLVDTPAEKRRKG
jgi:hypothetical protein